MDVGIGIAGVAISAGAVIITAIKARSNGNTNGNSKPCPLHSGIEATLKYLTDGMDEVKEDIKELLRKRG
jgi:hypothetical protein